MADDIVALLRARKPFVTELHESAPFLTKERWTALGDKVAHREHVGHMVVSPMHCFSLRLDIKNMSKHRKAFGKGWNQNFADSMVATMHELAKEFQAKWAFSQSDEITLIIVPPSTTESPHYQHPYGGKRDKLVSLSAAFASAVLNQHLREWVEMEPVIFDSRLAVWEDEAEAFQLIIWRAYDCSVNSVSDAIFHEGSSKIHMTLPTRKKLHVLAQEGKLPLPLHQAYGTLIQKQKRSITSINRYTNKEETNVRTVYEPLPSRNILVMIHEGLFDSLLKKFLIAHAIFVE